MLQTIPLMVRGMPMNVVYDYTPEELETWEYPGQKQSIEIEQISARPSGLDLTAILTEELSKEIRQLITDSMNDQRKEVVVERLYDNSQYN